MTEENNFCVIKPNMLKNVLPEPVFCNRNNDHSDHISPVYPEK